MDASAPILSNPLPEFYDDLHAAFNRAWRLLELGTKDRRSVFHTPSIATIAEDCTPEVRTVVLSAASQKDATLRFHTDRRSGKFQQASSNV